MVLRYGAVSVLCYMSVSCLHEALLGTALLGKALLGTALLGKALLGKAGSVVTTCITCQSVNISC